MPLTEFDLIPETSSVFDEETAWEALYDSAHCDAIDGLDDN
jgi:hypothetical protein